MSARRPSTVQAAALAAIAVASSMLPNAASASPLFTHDECRQIAAVAKYVIDQVGRENLSVQFQDSIKKFIMPSVGKMTCDGSSEIITITDRDFGAYGTILVSLTETKQIDLQKRGVHTVNPTPHN